MGFINYTSHAAHRLVIINNAYCINYGTYNTPKLFLRLSAGSIVKVYKLGNCVYSLLSLRSDLADMFS